MESRSSQLISILLLILIVVGSIVFVFPLRDRIDGFQAEKVTANQELATLQGEYDKLSTLSEEISKSESTQEALKKAVPLGMKQDELILELIDMAESVGFNAKVLSFSLRSDQEYGNAIGISMSLTGNYSELIEFLQRLEAAERLLTVDSISVQRNSAEAITFGVNLEAYYQ